MQTKYLAILTVAVVALSLMLNPSPDKHRTTIKETVAQRNPLAGVLGVGTMTAFVSTYHSLGVASYTEVDDRVISLGAFGVIFVVH